MDPSTATFNGKTFSEGARNTPSIIIDGWASNPTGEWKGLEPDDALYGFGVFLFCHETAVEIGQDILRGSGRLVLPGDITLEGQITYSLVRNPSTTENPRPGRQWLIDRVSGSGGIPEGHPLHEAGVMWSLNSLNGVNPYPEDSITKGEPLASEIHSMLSIIPDPLA